jgi:CubicO group peptidase (beta-lactamase class C family)
MTVDPELTKLLAEAAGKRAGNVAAAMVERRAEPGVWLGFLGEANAERGFELGSISKAITGMLLADAIRRGEVTLETTVGALAPELESTPVAGATLRRLATHTSGLPRLPHTPAGAGRAVRHAYLGLDPYRGLSAERVLRDAARQRMKPPGERLYSNLGAALCGQLLVRAAGAEDFSRLLRDRITRPLGLDGMFVAERGHTAPAGRSGLGRRRQPWIMDGYAPAGGIVSTIGDLARLAQALLDGSAPGSDSVLPIDADTSGERRSGMFWVVQPGGAPGDHLVWHNGGTGGYSSFLALLPERGRALVVLSASGREADADRIAGGLMRALTAG